MEIYLTALANVFSLNNVISMFIGTFFGIFMGAIPGISVNVAVTLMLPFTLVQQGITGILMILGTYIGAVCGGAISSILLNVPGTPANAATCIDGYAMAKRGEPGRALGIAMFASVFGGIFSALCLMFLAPPLSRVAIRFGSAEFFALTVFGLSIITGVSGKSVAKGIIGGLLGLLIATIGMDPMTSRLRFTFGSVYLLGGISFVPALIGIYAFSQALVMLEESYGKSGVTKIQKLTRVFPAWSDIKLILPTLFRSSTIGTFIGVVPGTGGDIAAFLSYNEAKRWSKHKDDFGKGAAEGIAAPESASNGVTGGGMVPMLTLGIPGDGAIAIIMGAFLVQGLAPGPLLFREHPSTVYSIFVGLIVANLIMCLLAYSSLRLFTQVLKIPVRILTPLVIVLACIGAFCINNSYIDIFVMFFLGVIGFILIKMQFTMAPILLGMILGRIAESNLRITLLTARGDLTVFFTRPIALAFLIAAALTLCSPLLKHAIKRLKESRRKA